MIMRVALALLLSFLATAPVAAQAQEEELRVGHALGAAHAPVVVIEFLDFGCAACAQFAHTSFPVIRADYVETGRVRWIAVPFVLGAFRHSEQAARAAVCTAGEGKFWTMHDTLFVDRRWSMVRNPDTTLLELARAVGADTDAFQTCYRDRATRNRVRDARALATKRKIAGTPTFFINGRRVVGAPPLPLFRGMLDDAALTAQSSTTGVR
jgi:protein-disulfide isomerase